MRIASTWAGFARSAHSSVNPLNPGYSKSVSSTSSTSVSARSGSPERRASHPICAISRSTVCGYGNEWPCSSWKIAAEHASPVGALVGHQGGDGAGDVAQGGLVDGGEGRGAEHAQEPADLGQLRVVGGLGAEPVRCGEIRPHDLGVVGDREDRLGGGQQGRGEGAQRRDRRAELGVVDGTGAVGQVHVEVAFPTRGVVACEPGVQDGVEGAGQQREGGLGGRVRIRAGVELCERAGEPPQAGRGDGGEARRAGDDGVEVTDRVADGGEVARAGVAGFAGDQLEVGEPVAGPVVLDLVGRWRPG